MIARALSGLLGLAAAGCASTSFRDPLLAGVDAAVIVAIADGDYRASTYADGALAPVAPNFADRLLVWTAGEPGVRRLPVSNSVTSPPEVVAVSPDRRFAYVVERLGQRRAGMTRSTDLPAGTRLTAVPLGAEAGPRTAVALGPYPEAIDLRADGRMIAAVSNSAEGSFVHLVPVADGALGRPVRFDLRDLGIVGAPAAKVNASSVFWQPGGAALAVTINTQARVAFFRLTETPSGPRLAPWGAPVSTGPDPFTGRFTPDGRHFLTLDWGRRLDAPSLEQRLPTTPSRISVIRLAAAADPTATHRRLGSVATDLSSEGIAISPDGALVAAVSMRGTPLPPTSARHTRLASVTLLHFDGEAGTLTVTDRVPFAAVLPEGATFDRSGRTLLVTSFEEPDRAGGALHLFAVRGRGAAARLERRAIVRTDHGIHHVVVR